MIRVIVPDSYAESIQLLEQYYELRHRIFVERLGWKGLTSVSGREKDRFDEHHTIYALATDDSGENVLGGSRISHSMLPSLSSDVFPHLFSGVGSVPRSELIYDSSRAVLDLDNVNKADQEKVSEELFCGCFGVGVALGVEAYTGVMYMSAIQHRMSEGMRIDVQGLPDGELSNQIAGILIPYTDEQLDFLFDCFGPMLMDFCEQYGPELRKAHRVALELIHGKEAA